MANKIIEIHKLRDKRLHVFKRDDCRVWMCRVYVNGKYKVSSTKEENLSRARAFAEEWFDDIKYRKRRGENIHDAMFEDVAQSAIERQNQLSASKERNSRHGEEFEKKVTGILLKQFKGIPIGQIGVQKLDDFKAWRFAEAKPGALLKQRRRRRQSAHRQFTKILSF